MRFFRRLPGASAVLLCAALAGGCKTTRGPVRETVPVQTALSQGQPGYQLAMEVAGCWFGSLWVEAEGVPPPLQRLAVERRCTEIAREVFGDSGRVIALKNLEPAEVEAAAQRAARDGGEIGPQLSRLVVEVAGAQREALNARRAAERFERDRGKVKADRLEHEEIGAVELLRAHDALERLLKADLGELTADARALGLLVGIARLRTAWTLPRHMRIYAVDSVGHAVFGTKLPEEAQVSPADITKPVRQGLFLDHVAALAAAAGYPVAETLKPRERRMLAWQGLHHGLADKLREEEKKFSRHAGPTLRRIVELEIEQLLHEYDQAQKLLKG